MTNGQRKRARATAKHTGAVIYLRVSTAKQAKSGVGIEAQLAKCTEHAQRLGLPVLAVHRDEAISGKDGIEKRPGLRAVLADVKANPGSVCIVYSLSRLGRSQRLIWTLLDDRGEYALPLASASEPFETATPMGRAMLGMLGVWAQLESDLASERTIDALAAVAERGDTKLGAPSMVESTREVEGQTRKERFVDAAKVAVVADVQRLYASGEHSHRSLADHLNATGVPTASGKRWHAKTVRTALGVELGA
jgi:site-specific DNA recombinase